MRGSLQYGHAKLSWHLSSRLYVSVKETWDATGEEDSQGTAHAVGHLTQIGRAAGCRTLALNLSQASLDTDSRREVEGFAEALRAEGWQVILQLPASVPGATVPAAERSEAGRLGRSLKIAGEAIVSAERFALRVLLLASVVVNSVQFVAWEAKYDHNSHSTVAAAAPDTMDRPGPSRSTASAKGAPMPCGSGLAETRPGDDPASQGVAALLASHTRPAGPARRRSE